MADNMRRNAAPSGFDFGKLRHSVTQKENAPRGAFGALPNIP
jgi:hypothetical protein